MVHLLSLGLLAENALIQVYPMMRIARQELATGSGTILTLSAILPFRISSANLLSETHCSFINLHRSPETRRLYGKNGTGKLIKNGFGGITDEHS